MNFGFSVNSCSSKRRRMASRYASILPALRMALRGFSGRFKTADKVFGDFTHATQRNVRRIFFPDRRREGGRGSESTRPWSMARCNKARDWQSVRGPASAHACSENAASVQGSPLRKTDRHYSLKACRAFRRLWRRRPREAFPDKIRRVCAGDHEFMDGIASKYVEQAIPFFHAGIADPRFDGDGDWRLFKNAIQQPFKRRNMTEKTGTLALGSHRAGRTAGDQWTFAG